MNPASAPSSLSRAHKTLRMPWARGRRPAAASSLRGARDGVALVITLIMLAVITFMAIAFLVVSRSEHGAVATQTDQTTARLAADQALERAEAEALAQIMAFTNEFNFDLLVSTNYISSVGFISSPGNPAIYTSPTNVSYSLPNGMPVSGNDALQNLANLLINPRAPVYVKTNRNQTTPPDFRFYLDLNRNGRFESNGYLPVMNPAGGYYNTNGNLIPLIVPGATMSNYFVGDPEWIAGLDRPDLPHSATNRFLYRYAYLVVPASKTLDLNYIYNYARLRDAQMGPGTDSFTRNQGAATWEINLAALLVDLNTNIWPYPNNNTLGSTYLYNTDIYNLPNTGVAFEDALLLLNYRYGARYKNQATFQDYVNNDPNSLRYFLSDFVDGYVHGPLMTGFHWPSLVDADIGRTTFAWSGSDNLKHFFTTQELFDKNKSSTFANHLLLAGTNSLSSYDRYTFYRLLATLGTDSAPEPPGKMNLNYDNLVQGNRFTALKSATNFIPWRPIDFFTNAADRLLANAGFTFNTANIQIWPTNYYSASVQRLLQLAANMYDASTTNTLVPVSAARTNPPGLPSVFRPHFLATRTNTIIITGFEEVTNANAFLSPTIRLRDLSIPDDRAQLKPTDMVSGVPLIIGAKKGLPNFNEFAMQTEVQVTRKLQFVRSGGSTTSPIVQTNQMFVVGISNTFGLEAWNSYTNAFPANLRMIVSAEYRGFMTNETSTVISLIGDPIQGFYRLDRVDTNFNANSWQGSPIRLTSAAVTPSFRVPLMTNFMTLSNATYRGSTKKFVPLTGIFEIQSHFPVPHWWLNLEHRVTFTLIDTDLNRIVDYVNLNGWDQPVDVTYTLMQGAACLPYTGNDGSDGGQWCTNRLNGNGQDNPTAGIMNQIKVGTGQITPQNWNSFIMEPPAGQDVHFAIDFFRAQFGLGPLYNPGSTFYQSNAFYAPFNPTRTVYISTKWQANDPLVHYTVPDLTDLVQTNVTVGVAFPRPVNAVDNIGSINRRYEPWGGGPTAGSTSPTRLLLSVKDPLVTRSDDWDFPSGKYPNVGWLGRVHRGTPWQTVYLKSPQVDLHTWTNWTGNGQVVIVNSNIISDGFFTQPMQDRYILDLFTAAFNENATRGQMSVNQTNLAAWSAILSGVIAVTNTPSETDFINNGAFQLPQFAPWVIQPAGAYGTTSGVARIVHAINDVRATNSTRKVFSRMGEILAVPELTVNSPFLNAATNQAHVLQFGLNDAAYERIPQQILGLLRGDSTPRFVIYSYGQTLKPADRSIYTRGGPYFGMCTNYQVTAEAATRAVVRIDGIPANPQPVPNPPPLDNLHVVIENFNVLQPD